MPRKPFIRKRAASRHDQKVPTTSLHQAIIMFLVAPALFLILIEGGLALFGVEPELRTEDPFVGFAGNIPLFEEGRAPNGLKIRSTAKNKQQFFNRQMFVEEKAPDTYRIFCLGGSTTYGRPYNDVTSFPGWLRELLPAVDSGRDWEVINVGGISYASYRVARLMEELVQYQPDLFIIYTGQNEFLEERTYGTLRAIPEPVRSTVGVLAETRTWAALKTALGRAGMIPEKTQPGQAKLAAEVDAILDHSTGPKDYQRDDALREGVLEHYRIGLRRMADIARRAGARVIFVTPASNLKDCSPFKSEHTAGLSDAQRLVSGRLLSEAKARMQEERWEAALSALDRGIALDPRFAELHFSRGRSLLALQRFNEAKAAFQRAMDEDVCPLRAVAPMPEMVADVAREEGAVLVDFVGLMEQATLARTGHSIPGEEYFLDHVHPTIKGHKLLAAALLDSMIGEKIVQPGGKWHDATLAAVDARIRSRIDPHMQAQALINLAKVLHWAGKYEEARRLAEQGLAAARGEGTLTSLASNILIKIAKLEEDHQRIDQYIREALALDPRSPVMHYQLGIRLLQKGMRHQGAAHILYASAFWEDNETTSVLGLILYNGGRPDLAYPLLQRALELDSTDRISRMAVAEMEQDSTFKAPLGPPPGFVVSRYPSGAPKEIFLDGGRAADGVLPDGLITEWYEDGSLKRCAEYLRGVRHGTQTQWSPGGEVLDVAFYERGVRSGS